MKYINQIFISFDWISFGEGLIVMLAHSKLYLIMLPLQSYVIVWCAIFHTLVKFKMVFCTKTTFLNSGNRHHSIHVSGQVLHWSISYEYLIHQLFRRRKSLKPRPQHEIYHTRFASCKMACFKLNFIAEVMYIEKQIKTAWYFDRLGMLRSLLQNYCGGSNASLCIMKYRTEKNEIFWVEFGVSRNVQNAKIQSCFII